MTLTWLDLSLSFVVPEGKFFFTASRLSDKKEKPATDRTTQRQSKAKHRNKKNNTSRPSLHINTSHCTQWGLLLRDVMAERIRFLALLHFRAMYLRPEGSEAYRTKKTSVSVKEENSNTVCQTFLKQHYVVSKHAKPKYWRGVVLPNRISLLEPSLPAQLTWTLFAFLEHWLSQQIHIRTFPGTLVKLVALFLFMADGETETR